MDRDSWVVIGVAILFAAFFISFELSNRRSLRRRERLRQRAEQMATNPPATWQPYFGERKTLYRSGDDPDLLAEVLRATAQRYIVVAQAYGFTVEIREIKVPQQRGPIEGQVTIEVVPLPATTT